MRPGLKASGARSCRPSPRPRARSLKPSCRSCKSSRTCARRWARTCGPAPLVWRGEIRLSGCRAHSDRPHAGASLGRGSVAQGRVQALPIVKHLDVLEHRGPRLRAGAEPGLMNALRLERGEEALHGRIVQAIAASAHRLLDAMSLQHRPIRPRRVLDPAVAMMNEPPRRL